MLLQVARTICIRMYFGTAACIWKPVTDGWLVTIVALIAVIEALFGAFAKSMRIWMPLPW